MNYVRGTIVYEIPTCITAISFENRDNPTISVAKGQREEFADVGKDGWRFSKENGYAGRGFVEAICKVHFLANSRKEQRMAHTGVSRFAILAVAFVTILSSLSVDPIVFISVSKILIHIRVRDTHTNMYIYVYTMYVLYMCLCLCLCLCMYMYIHLERLFASNVCFLVRFMSRICLRRVTVITILMCIRAHDYTINNWNCE